MATADRLWISTRSVSVNEIMYIEICLGNSGTYIDQSEVKKIFDLFYTSGKQGGTGLGLAIAQKVVRKHGGTIWCESDPEKGTRFYIRVPAADPIGSSVPLPTTTSKQRDPHREAVITGASARAPRQHVKILIADDEQVYRRILSEKIRENVGANGNIEIIEAKTTDDAVRLAAEFNPDIVFMDVDFHDSADNGFDAAKKIRSQLCRSAICFHTNHPEESVRERSGAAGVEGIQWLSKPVDTGDLKNILSEAIAAT